MELDILVPQRKNTTYDYNNVLRMPNNKPTALDAKVDVKGFSMTKFRFQIDCQNKEYTAKEISFAKDPSKVMIFLKHLELKTMSDGSTLKSSREIRQNKKVKTGAD